MPLTRRRILQTATAFGLIGTRSWSATQLSLDDMTVQTISDGHLVLPMAFAVPADADPADVQPILDAAGISGPNVQAPLNVTLLRQGDALVLFDVGSGPDFMPTAGQLVDALAAVDVTPDQITDVLFTHAHPDHIWGVLDEFDEPVFVNAQHRISDVERDYWTDPATAETIGAERQSFAAGAQRRIDTMGEALGVFADGDEVLPGIRAKMTPGHTPGHTCFDVGGKLFVIGDAIGNGHLGLRRPDLLMPADQDPVLGAATRVALLRQLADYEGAVVGYHIPDGGLGRIRSDGNAFAFVPEV